MSLTEKQQTIFAILIGALGYFVDVYDIALFSVVRVASLKDLGLAPEEILNKGVFLLNCQMAGMLIGGLIFGVIGDKKGRLQVLFGSILLYSIANIANAYVDSFEYYALWRFLTGVGLAGELGAGITLVAELMPRQYRGYGTTIIATVGVAGGVAAGLVGDLFYWRTAYIIGGVMGLALLVLRLSVHESGLFAKMLKKEKAVRGDLRLLFSRKCLLRYISCILVGAPTWFFIGIIVTFSPEIGQALNIEGAIKPAQGIFLAYIGLVLGDMSWGLISQWLQSRKKPIAFTLFTSLAATLVLLGLNGTTPFVYYAFCLGIGFLCGYWVLYVTTAAEQFGTNMRATVAISVPNFVRGFTVVSTLMFTHFKAYFSVTASVAATALIVYGLALTGLYFLKESFSRDLDFLEA